LLPFVPSLWITQIQANTEPDWNLPCLMFHPADNGKTTRQIKCCISSFVHNKSMTAPVQWFWVQAVPLGLPFLQKQKHINIGVQPWSNLMLIDRLLLSRFWYLGQHPKVRLKPCSIVGWPSRRSLIYCFCWILVECRGETLRMQNIICPMQRSN